VYNDFPGVTGMFRQALRAVLAEKVKNLAPKGLADSYGDDGLAVYLEEFSTVSVNAGTQSTAWKDCTLVAVLYAVDDIERLVHHLVLTPLILAHEANGLAAKGAARFKNLKEGPIQGVMYAELRFDVQGTLGPSTSL